MTNRYVIRRWWGPPLIWTLSMHIYPQHVFRAIGVKNRSRQLWLSQVKCKFSFNLVLSSPSPSPPSLLKVSIFYVAASPDFTYFFIFAFIYLLLFFPSTTQKIRLRKYKKRAIGRLVVSKSWVEAVFEVKHTCRSKLVVVSPELSVCRHHLYQASHQEQPKGPRPATSETKQESALKQQEVNRWAIEDSFAYQPSKKNSIEPLKRTA